MSFIHCAHIAVTSAVTKRNLLRSVTRNVTVGVTNEIVTTLRNYATINKNIKEYQSCFTYKCN